MVPTSTVLFEDAEYTILPVATLAAKGMVWHFRPSETPDTLAAMRDLPFEGSFPVRVMERKKASTGITYNIARVVRTSW
jgi:hypothetical protein